MLGLEVSQTELSMLGDSMTGELKALLKKVFLPELTGEEPLGQEVDLWMTIEVANKSPLDADIAIKSRKVLIGMINEGLACLFSGKSATGIVDFKPMPNKEAQLVKIIARNTYIGHLKQMLVTLKVLSGLKSETQDEQKKRLTQDSSK
jgi:hypothetical protein